MSRIGKTIIDRLERFANDLEGGVDIAKRYTCREMVLDHGSHSVLKFKREDRENPTTDLPSSE